MAGDDRWLCVGGREQEAPLGDALLERISEARLSHRLAIGHEQRIVAKFHRTEQGVTSDGDRGLSGTATPATRDD
jgi:hypothetical protein